MTENIELIELEEFIKNTLFQIEKGGDIGNRTFKDAVEFEISISKIQKTGGSVKIYVANGIKEINKENVAKIKFQIFPKYPKENLRNEINEEGKNWRIGQI